MSQPLKTFKIGTVAKLTGISTHALRIWEKRYNLAPPLRAPGGGRLYTDAEITRFELIKKLIDGGHAISQIAHLPVAELDQLVQHRTETPARADEPVAASLVVSKFLLAVSELQLARADRILGHAAIALEPRAMIDEVLVPIFRQIGQKWAAGELSVAEEHGASAVLRNQLAALMRLFASDTGRGPVVTATLTGELHEFGALLAALTAAVLGWRVLYLGPDLPPNELVFAARASLADVVMLSVVYKDSRKDLALVRKSLPRRVALLAGGSRALHYDLPGVQVIPTLGGLETWLIARAKRKSSTSATR